MNYGILRVCDNVITNCFASAEEALDFLRNYYIMCYGEYVVTEIKNGEIL